MPKDDEKKVTKLKATYLGHYLTAGGTEEGFEAEWPELGKSVFGQAAIDAVNKGKARARRQMRVIWGGGRG